MDPFVAFALGQGIAGTREQATALRMEYETWLASRGNPISDEDLIDPQIFLDWNRLRPRAERQVPNTVPLIAVLSDVDGKLPSYAVRPIRKDDGVIWIDPAGFQVARSEAIPGTTDYPEGHDFEVANDQFGVRVSRTF